MNLKQKVLPCDRKGERANVAPLTQDASLMRLSVASLRQLIKGKLHVEFVPQRLTEANGTRPSRPGQPSGRGGCLTDGVDDVLAPQRNALEVPLEPPQLAQRGREEEGVRGPGHVETGGPGEPDHLPPGQEPGITSNGQALTRYRVTGLYGLCSKTTRCPPADRRRAQESIASVRWPGAM